MVRSIFKVLLVDAVLSLGGYFILRDLQWRTGFAISESLTPSFSYGPLTQIFALSGRTLTLNSPPTLDWVQVIIGVLVVLNGWYLFRACKGRSRSLNEPKA